MQNTSLGEARRQSVLFRHVARPECAFWLHRWHRVRFFVRRLAQSALFREALTQSAPFREVAPRLALQCRVRYYIKFENMLLLSV